MSWMVAEDATNELPAGVRKIVEARTGDAVFVIAPDYRVV